MSALPATLRHGSLLILVLLALLFRAPAAAQESRLQMQSATVDDWPVIDVTLTAFDGAGQPATGLTRDSFSADLSGTDVEISSLRTTSDPGLGIAVVLAFDVSGSMAGTPLEQAKEAGKALVGQLRSDDQAAILAFGSEVSVVEGFTRDKEVLETSIDQLALGGDTALYTGVGESAQLLEDSGLPRRAIVLLSDGYDFGGISDVSREESLQLIELSGALTFTVGLGPEIDQAYLSEVAAAGGGQFLIAPEPDGLTNAYLAAGEVLRHQYVLTLDASGLEFEDPEADLRIDALIGDEAIGVSTRLTLPEAAIVQGPEVQEPAEEPVEGIADPEPETVEEPAVQSELTEESGGLPWVEIAGLCAFLLLGGGAALLIVGRRHPGPAPGSAESGEPDRIGQLAVEAPPALVFPEIRQATGANGSSAWIEGAGTDRVMLSGTPVTVGMASDCDIRLEGPARGEVRLRIWRRDGSYMVHNLSQPMGMVTINGRPVSWAILEDGDEIVVGASTLAFHDSGGS